MGRDIGLMSGFFSNLISFNLTKRKKLSTCQDLKHRINPTVIISSKLCDFSHPKVTQSGFPLHTGKHSSRREEAEKDSTTTGRKYNYRTSKNRTIHSPSLKTEQQIKNLPQQLKNRKQKPKQIQTQSRSL